MINIESFLTNEIRYFSRANNFRSTVSKNVRYRYFSIGSTYLKLKNWLEHYIT